MSLKKIFTTGFVVPVNSFSYQHIGQHLVTGPEQRVVKCG